MHHRDPLYVPLRPSLCTIGVKVDSDGESQVLMIVSLIQESFSGKIKEGASEISGRLMVLFPECERRHAGVLLEEV